MWLLEQFTARRHVVAVAANVQASPQDSSVRSKLYSWSFAYARQFHLAVTRVSLIFLCGVLAVFWLRHHNQFVYDDDDDNDDDNEEEEKEVEEEEEEEEDICIYLYLSWLQWE